MTPLAVQYDQPSTTQSPEVEALPVIGPPELGWATFEPFTRALAGNMFHVIDTNIALGRGLTLSEPLNIRLCQIA